MYLVLVSNDLRNPLQKYTKKNMLIIFTPPALDMFNLTTNDLTRVNIAK